MLVVKTGMAAECAAVTPLVDQDVRVLTGLRTLDDLRAAVPQEATALISVGLAGGLSPQVKAGEVYVASIVRTPTGNYAADRAWARALSRAVAAPRVVWWSTDQMNTGNTEDQRANLYAQTYATVIDDETWAVARLAVERGIKWAALRAISDGGTTDLPPAVVKALNADGSIDLMAVIASVVEHPGQIPALIETALDFKKGIEALKEAVRKAGPRLALV